MRRFVKLKTTQRNDRPHKQNEPERLSALFHRAKRVVALVRAALRSLSIRHLSGLVTLGCPSLATHCLYRDLRHRPACPLPESATTCAQQNQPAQLVCQPRTAASLRHKLCRLSGAPTTRTAGLPQSRTEVGSSICIEVVSVQRDLALTATHPPAPLDHRYGLPSSGGGTSVCTIAASAFPGSLGQPRSGCELLGRRHPGGSARPGV